MDRSAAVRDAEEARLATESLADGTLRVRVGGYWSVARARPDGDAVLAAAGADTRRLAFVGTELAGWDTTLLALLVRLVRAARARGLESDLAGLPIGLRRLVELALAAPAGDEAPERAPPPRFLARLGTAGLARARGAWTALVFLGEATVALARLARGKARFRAADFWREVQACGARALGIVGLISFLIGLILAYMGAVQLELFGAELYVANLVAIGMAREMSAMMTGIVLAGRTGAAFAAELGTMTVNEEIDALRVLGIEPMEFLVLPRMLALVLMTPLLALYANALGIFGGFVVGTGLLDIAPTVYWTQTLESVEVADFAVGLIKATVVGALVAIAGCLRGLASGRTAEAVGLATTSAVVTGIVLIIVSEAVFAVLFQALGI